MKTIFTLLFVSLVGYSGIAQSHDHPLQVVYKFFEGLHSGDGAMVTSCLAEDARLFTSGIDEMGKPFRMESSIAELAAAVERPREAKWLETLTNIEMEIDDPMATIWTDYQFHLGDKLNHCGVNSFHLYRGADGWKILHLMDTRHKTNCDVNDDYEEVFANIDSTVWDPFKEAYLKNDAHLFMSVHSPNVMRITGSGIKDSVTYARDMHRAFDNRKQRGAEQKIDLNFLSRQFNGSSAYETGIYTITDPAGFKHYGYFHVQLKKYSGAWKIEIDWDTDQLGSMEINEAFLSDMEK